MMVDRFVRHIFILYVFMGAIVLRLSGVENLVPFDQWQMFSVRPNMQKIYFVFAFDPEKKTECLLQRCQKMIPGYAVIYVNLWTQRLGQALDKSDLETARIYKKMIQRLPKRDHPLVLTLYSANIDMVHFSQTRQIENKEKVFEFSQEI